MGVDAYADQATNQIYNLLFADDVDGFGPAEGDQQAIADDDTAESRRRVVAFRRLAAGGTQADAKPPLLGVIVEIAMDEGLDTLAAYADGSVRYINHGGGMTIVEPGGPLLAQVGALLLAGRPAVDAIGPWHGERQPPPPAGQARLTFLVGGQIYFGQGPFGALANDDLAGPVIQAALALLQAVVALQGFTGQA